MLILMLVSAVAAKAPDEPFAQTWGQPRPATAPLGPRLPIGETARRVVAPTTGAAPTPRDPFVGPVRTITYVVTPEVRVRPSEVVIDPPEVHFVTTPGPMPSDPATDTAPK